MATHSSILPQRIPWTEELGWLWGCKELDTFERLTLSLSEKNTRPFMYDLNQILYDQTVEVINSFRDRVPEELWTELCNIVQEVVTKTIPKKKKCKKAKWLSQEALQIAEKRREPKGKGEKERYTHLNAQFQRIARRDKNNAKKQRKTIVWERLAISSRKLEIPREYFMQRWALDKGQKQYGPNRSRRY